MMNVSALLLNVLCVVASFFIISSKRVPDLKKHPVGAFLLRLAVTWGLAVACAYFLSTPIVIFRKPLVAEEVIRFGIPAGVCSLLLALGYFGLQHLLYWWKNRQ
jgi:hypothetical protein